MKSLAPFLGIALLMWPACSAEQQSQGPSENEKVEAAIRERKQYQEEIEAKIRELDQEIDTLKAKIEKEGKEGRKQLDQEMTELEQKRELARQEIEKFKNSSQAAWRDFKPGIDAAISDLEAAYKRAAAHFK